MCVGLRHQPPRRPASGELDRFDEMLVETPHGRSPAQVSGSWSRERPLKSDAASARLHAVEVFPAGHGLYPAPHRFYGIVIGSGNAAELLEALEEVLDQMAPFAHLGVVRDQCDASRLGGG